MKKLFALIVTVALFAQNVAALGSFTSNSQNEAVLYNPWTDSPGNMFPLYPWEEDDSDGSSLYDPENRWDDPSSIFPGLDPDAYFPTLDLDDFLPDYDTSTSEEDVGNDTVSLVMQLLNTDYTYAEFYRDALEAEETVFEARWEQATALHANSDFQYYVNDYIPIPKRLVTNKINVKAAQAYKAFDEIFTFPDDKVNYYEVVLLYILTDKTFEDKLIAESDSYSKAIQENLLKLGLPGGADSDTVLESIEQGVLESSRPVVDASDIFGVAVDVTSTAVKTAAALDSSISNVAALAMAEESRMKILRKIKEATDNPVLRLACEELEIKYNNAISSSYLAYINATNEGLAPVRTFIVETVFNLAFGSVTRPISVTKAILNIGLNVDEVTAHSMALAAYAEIGDIVSEIINDAGAEFINEANYYTADQYIALADFYKVLLLSGCDEAVEYVDALPTDRIARLLAPPNFNRSPFVLDDSVSYFRYKNANEFDEIYMSSEENVPKNTGKFGIREHRKKILNTNFYAGSVDFDAYIKEKRSTSYSAWAKTEVEKAKSIGILPEDLCCNYQEAITRGEFCTLLTHMLMVKTGKTIETLIEESGVQLRTPFTDTNYKYVDYIYKLGIVNGVSETEFAPMNSITREQAATMLTRASQLLGHDINVYEILYDVNYDSVSPWAKRGVSFVIENGIMGGTEKGFEPQGVYTKEQAIVTMLRVYNNL